MAPTCANIGAYKSGQQPVHKDIQIRGSRDNNHLIFTSRQFTFIKKGAVCMQFFADQCYTAVSVDSIWLIVRATECTHPAICVL